ncbi:MAG: NAD(P)/FAD-dependent oxidoreductase [Dehalococcoidia bacterium]|nr:NAD(P)/FAD-dependent oxidoreductase [Dehalococcoidia bacterium]
MIQTTASSDTEIVDVAIVGAGFGGLCQAIFLQDAGITSFVILEKASDIAGTWRDNTYPGCACDVQSHMYSFSFYGKPDWSKRYAPWHEIQAYIHEVTDHYGLRPKIRLGWEVSGARFDEKRGLWTLQGKNGKTVVARHWVLASGPLHVPAFPDIPGLSRFKGKVMHSAEWDHGYELRGKRVASIGTGGSAIQYAPEIAPDVSKLHVFQRTPAWVIPRDERPYLALEKSMFRRFPALRKLHRARLYWTNESRVWPIFKPSLASTLQNLAKLSIRLQVKDREIAKKLTPEYTIGCKRVLISNKWYPMFNRDNVELVTDGIREITETSVITKDGRERPVDCIILGTGFVVDPRIYMRDFEFVGVGGRRLQDDWKDSAEAYYGITVHGYPNFYMLVGPNTGLGHNSILFMIECQARYVVKLIELARSRGADYVDVKESAQRTFNDELQKEFDGTVWTTGCASWYQQADGKNIALWPSSTWRYWRETRDVAREAYEFVTCATEHAQPSPESTAAP